MSYSGIPGWIILGITNIEHRWHQYTSIGIVNVDLSKFTQIVLISDEMARDPPGTSNIISSFQISNSNSNSTTFQINSVLEAHTGNRGNYFGTSSTFTIGKNMSDVSNLEIKKNFNFDGGVASIQNDRKSVVLLDENKFILVSNDKSGKILKSVNYNVNVKNASRYFVTGQNNMIYSFSFTEQFGYIESVNMNK